MSARAEAAITQPQLALENLGKQSTEGQLVRTPTTTELSLLAKQVTLYPQKVPTPVLVTGLGLEALWERAGLSTLPRTIEIFNVRSGPVAAEGGIVAGGVRTVSTEALASSMGVKYVTVSSEAPGLLSFSSAAYDTGIRSSGLLMSTNVPSNILASFANIRTAYPSLGTVSDATRYGVPSIPVYPTATYPSISVPRMVNYPSIPSMPYVPYEPVVPSVPSTPYVPNYPAIIIPPFTPPTYARVPGQEQKRKKAFHVQIKRRGKFLNVGPELPFGRALEFGSKKARESIAATFRLKEAGTTELEDIQFVPSTRIFRTYQVHKGQRIDLPLTFIQRRGTRLGTAGEVAEITAAKKSKMANKLMFGGLFSV
jgi:hypothetical protein